MSPEMYYRQKVKLSDIAEVVGVSSVTVGKVLNGGNNSVRVSKKTQDRIWEVARQLHYKPNRMASVLAGGKSKLIGILHDVGLSYRGTRLLSEIELQCTANGYRLISGMTHDNVEILEDNYNTMQHYGVDGVICLAHNYPNIKNDFSSMIKDEENIIFLGKPQCKNMPYVEHRQFHALKEMLKKAIAEGVRNPATFCGSQIWQSEQQLTEDFKNAMEANQMTLHPEMIFECDEDCFADLNDWADYMIHKKIQRYKPDFLFIDDSKHCAVLQTHLLRHGISLKLFGGDADPLFKGIGVQSLDPQYGKIAGALVSYLIKKEKKENYIETVESIY